MSTTAAMSSPQMRDMDNDDTLVVLASTSQQVIVPPIGLSSAVGEIADAFHRKT
jgi:hypothetical protein